MEEKTSLEHSPEQTQSDGHSAAGHIGPGFGLYLDRILCQSITSLCFHADCARSVITPEGDNRFFNSRSGANGHFLCQSPTLHSPDQYLHCSKCNSTMKYDNNIMDVKSAIRQHFIDKHDDLVSQHYTNYQEYLTHSLSDIGLENQEGVMKDQIRKLWRHNETTSMENEDNTAQLERLQTFHNILERQVEETGTHVLAMIEEISHLRQSNDSHEHLLKIIQEVATRVRNGKQEIIQSIIQKNESSIGLSNLQRYRNEAYIQQMSMDPISSPDVNRTDVLEHNLQALVLFLSIILHTSDNEVVLDNLVEKNINLAIAVICGIVLNTSNALIKSPIANLLSFQVRQSTGSTFAVDIIAKALGGVTNKAITTSIQDLADTAQKCGVSIPAGTSIIVCWDNLGTYKAGSSRAQGGKRQQIITTTRAIYHVERLNTPLIQMVVEYAPFNDKPWEDVPDNYVLVHKELQTYQNISVSDSLPAIESDSEQQFLDGEINGYLFDSFTEVLNREGGVDVLAMIPTVESEAAILAESDIKVLYPIVCPVTGCGKRYRIRKQICDFCGHRPLPTIGQTRESLKQSDLIDTILQQKQRRIHKNLSNGVTTRYVHSYIDPSAPGPPVVHITKNSPHIQCDKLEPLESSSSLNTMDDSSEDQRPLDSAGKRIQSTEANERAKKRAKVAGGSYENTRITTQVLPSLNLNPNSKANIREIMNQFLREIKIAGFEGVVLTDAELQLLFGEDADTIEIEFAQVDDVVQVLQWIWSVSDEGAASTDDTDYNVDMPVFQRIRQMFSPGHCWAVIIRTVSDVLFNYGFEDLAALYGTGFTSPKALYSLRKGCDLRKLRDFLYSIRQSFTNCFVREFLVVWNVNEDGSESNEAPSLEDFLEFIGDRETDDEMFKNLSFIAFHILPALAIVEKGMRNNHMASFWSGVKYLLPLLVIRNNYKYVPVILREIGIYQYLCPDAVKEEYKLIWCFFGQGLDFILEEVNRRIKRKVTRGSFQEYLVASILHDQQGDLTATLLANLGLDPQEVLGEYIQQTEIIKRDIDKMENYIMKNRFCRKSIDGSRASVSSLVPPKGDTDERAILDDRSILTIMKSAHSYTAEYASKFKLYRMAMGKDPDQKEVLKPKLPPAIRMTKKEAKKKSISVFCDASFANNESDDEGQEDDEVENRAGEPSDSSSSSSSSSSTSGNVNSSSM